MTEEDLAERMAEYDRQDMHERANRQMRTYAATMRLAHPDSEVRLIERDGVILGAEVRHRRPDGTLFPSMLDRMADPLLA